MASSDGLDEDCVLQRGRSQSDPSSITEVRLGEAHRAGMGGGIGKTRVGHLSSNRFNRAGGSVGGTSRRQGSSGLVRGDPIEFVCSSRGLCCKRASFTIPLLPAVEPQI